MIALIKNGSVTSSAKQHHVASRVKVGPLGDIVDLAVNDNPAVIVPIVLLELAPRNCLEVLFDDASRGRARKRRHALP